MTIISAAAWKDTRTTVENRAKAKQGSTNSLYQAKPAEMMVR